MKKEKKNKAAIKITIRIKKRITDYKAVLNQSVIILQTIGLWFKKN